MARSQIETRGAVVVTGASTGIGQACALRLDKIGFQVFAGVRKEADGESLKRQASERLTSVFIDVTEEASIASAADTVAAAVGAAGLAGLVNNAGIVVPGPLEFQPLGDIRQQIDVNFIGQIAVTQAFLPLLRKRRGRIVNIGSIGGRMATPFLGAYAASKFAMEAFTDSLRMELQPWGISVSIVEPGSIATPLWEKGQASADEIDRKLPQTGHDLYDPAVAAMRRVADKLARAAIPPSAVAKAVAHALTAKRPKTRYLVGRDAKLQAAVAKLVPDRMRDWLIVQRMGLPRNA
jgi:NAD(P)-dependent dehydrogenase (short-subunit alcohol dehydrogenase family)